MGKREHAAEEADLRREAKIIGIAAPMLPSQHLAIVAKVKLVYEDISPSDVWRVLMSVDNFRYDYKTSMFFHINDETNKEG